MPTPPLSREQLDAAYDAAVRHGYPLNNQARKLAAADLGLTRSGFDKRFDKARAIREQDPGIAASMLAANTGLVPSVAWVKTKGKDGEPS